MTPIVLVCDDSELNEAAQTLAASLSLDYVTQIPDDERQEQVL